MAATTMEVILNETNNTSNVVSEERGIEDVTLLRTLRYILYAIIFIISLSGNLMVCAIITRRRKMKTITNYLIFNLAVSDVLYTIYVPLDIVASESNTWPFGMFFCKILYPLMTLSICVSALTLMVLALIRYRAVVFPFRRQISVIQVKSLIVVIWLVSVFEVIPYAIILKLTNSEHCEEVSWPSDQSSKIYTIALFLLQFAIPLTAIIFAYTMIGRELKQRDRRTENQNLEQKRNEESKKIIRMVVFVTATFAICNLPTSLLWIVNDFGPHEIPEFNDILFFFNILDFGNTAANPCIYLGCNDDFRREFCRYLAKLRRKDISQSRFLNTKGEEENASDADKLPTNAESFRHFSIQTTLLLKTSDSENVT